MLARIRKSMEDKDQGFTLIELLVVMIIIGILAAIAIPVFLNQRQKAVDSGLKSDLRTVAQQMETSFTDAQEYPEVSTAVSAVKVTSGNTIAGVWLSAVGTKATTAAAATGFCLTGTNGKASTGQKFIYNSLDGGLKTGASVACPA